MPPTDPLADVDRIARSPKVPAIDGSDLDWLINRYLDNRRTKVDAKTAHTYECRLRLVTGWWGEIGPTQTWLLRAADLEALEYHLRQKASANSGRPLSYTYRSGILQSLREVLRWACENGYLKNDYSSWVPAAYGSKTKRRAANEDDLLTLLAECDNSPRRIRDRAIIAIFVGMGLRCAEVTNLRLENLEFHPDYSGHAKVVGKRTKDKADGKRDAAFEAAAGKIIAEHVATLGVSAGPLFVSYRGIPMEPYTLYGIVKKLIKRAGLEDRIQACHDLRRAFTTFHARNRPGSDSAHKRQLQLGHASYSQTAEYELFDIEDIRRDIVSPLSLLEGRQLTTPAASTLAKQAAEITASKALQALTDSTGL